MKKLTLFLVFFIVFLFFGCGLPDFPILEESATSTPVILTEATFIDKVSPEDVRLFTYNVNWDSIFPDGDPENYQWRLADKSEAFRRLIAATSPDIACLQEINPDRDAGAVSAIFDEVLPLEGNAKWQAVSVYDTVIVSRFDLQSDGYELYIPPYQWGLGQAAALIDLPDDEYAQTDLYLVCSHFAASGDPESINQRQSQADVIIRQAGDMKTTGDYIDLAPDTPFVFAGDFNVYGNSPAYHLETLLTGDIVNEELFGEDVALDWDGTWLTDVLPSHNGGERYFYTWRNDVSDGEPFPLDRVIYSDSVMAVSHAYVLDTRTMSGELLQGYGLQADDVLIIPEDGMYDHFPMIVDFSF